MVTIGDALAMKTKVVYYPCAICAGTGEIQDSDKPTVLFICTECKGTGKGPVKEIIEELSEDDPSPPDYSELDL